MRLTVSDMLGDCYRRLNYASQPPSNVTTRLLAFLNDAETELLSLPGVSSLLNASLTFDSVAGQPVVALPPSVARVIAIRDEANQWRMRRITSQAYYSMMAAPQVEVGTPDAYAELGRRPVALDPSDASELFLISTSALDVQQAFYTAILSSGQTVTGSVTLTGITGVSLSLALTTIVQVTDLYLNSGAVGTITLREDSGAGSVLSSIYPNTLASNYTRLGLALTPAGVVTYSLDYEREQTRMANGTDTSILPEKFHRLLPLGALMREYQDKGDVKRMQMFQQDWARGVGLFNAFLASGPDVMVVPGGVRTQHSVLGPWTPADSYRGEL